MTVLLLIPRCQRALRRLANLNRRLARQWCGVPIAIPYLPPPDDGDTGYTGRLRWVLRDSATRRDLLWQGAGSVAGSMVAALPGGLALYGVIAFLAQVSGTRGPGLSIPVEVAAVAAGLWAAPWLLRAYGLLARTMLARSGRAELSQRVRHLAQTRTG